MSGGEISNNKTTLYGGGGIANHSTLNITGGQISGNTTVEDGGAIWNGKDCTLTISNATALNNLATRNGGGIWNGGTLKMKGEVCVWNNESVSNQQLATDNIHLDGVTVINITGALINNNETFVGVNISQANRYITAGYRASNPEVAATTIFQPDKEGYGVLYDYIDKDAQLANNFSETQFTDYSWDETNKKLIKNSGRRRCLTFGGDNAKAEVDLGIKDNITWYVPNSNTIRLKALKIYREVHIVLPTATTIELAHINIEARNNAKLHIHNTDGDESSGTIDVKNWYENSDFSYNDHCRWHSFYRYYDDAAAVGGGDGYDMGSLYMHGGTLSASIQDNRPAAIGGGKDGSIDPNHQIVVYAGVLKGEALYPTYAEETDEVLCDLPLGAAIGGSDNNPQGGSITVYGGKLWAISNGRGAGIGGGYEGGGGDVHIYGGTVEVVGGEKSAAIGGYQDHGMGNIEFASNMRVTAGGYKYITYDAIPEQVFQANLRKDACHYRPWAKVESCDHTPQNGDADSEASTYSIVDESYHDRYCWYCQTVIREQHATTGECPCGKNGYSFTTYVPSATTGGSGYQQKQTYKVKEDNEFYLPECDVVPTGYKFLGWEMNPNSEEADYDKWAAVRGGDISSDDKLAAGTSVKALKGMSNAMLYARYLYDFKDEWQWNDDYTECTLILSCDALPNTTYQVVFTQNDEIIKENCNEYIEYSIRYTYNKNGYNYKFFAKKKLPYELMLQDNADNSAIIVDKQVANVTLSGRTLYKDNAWNTICLPFNLVLAGSPLNGAEARPLTDASNTGTTLNLTFGDAVTELIAGTPYIIKWASGDNIVSPVFNGVTIDKTDRSYANAASGDARVRFLGTYKSTTFSTKDYSIIFVGGDNNLYYPESGAIIGAQRAYFKIGEGAAQARQFTSFNIDFGEGDVTGIITMSDVVCKMSDVWYSIDGRKLDGKPTARGIYINNGRKFVVK